MGLDLSQSYKYNTSQITSSRNYGVFIEYFTSQQTTRKRGAEILKPSNPIVISREILMNT